MIHAAPLYAWLRRFDAPTRHLAIRNAHTRDLDAARRDAAFDDNTGIVREIDWELLRRDEAEHAERIAVEREAAFRIAEAEICKSILAAFEAVGLPN